MQRRYAIGNQRRQGPGRGRHAPGPVCQATQNLRHLCEREESNRSVERTQWRFLVDEIQNPDWPSCVTFGWPSRKGPIGPDCRLDASPSCCGGLCEFCGKEGENSAKRAAVGAQRICGERSFASSASDSSASRQVRILERSDSTATPPYSAG